MITLEIPKGKVLGVLCRQKHDWNNTGQGLRYVVSGKCVKCILQKRKRYYQNNHESILQDQKRYRQNNHESILQQKKRYYQDNRESILQDQKRYYQDNHEIIRQQRKRYYQDNRESILQDQKRYYQDNKWNFFIWKSEKKAIKYKGLHIPYTAKDLDEMLEAFDNECAYCGSKYRVSADHFIPISKGGADATHNLVPACYSCNSSKRDREPLIWMNKKVERARQNKILNYLEQRTSKLRLRSALTLSGAKGSKKMPQQS